MNGEPPPDGEQVRLDLHPHWHRLVLPVLTLIVTVGLASYLFFVVPHGSLRWPLRWAIVGVALVVVMWRVASPWLRWLSTRYVVTNRRIMVRQGLLRRQGRDIPIRCVTEVRFDCTLLERMLRCGTLTIESAGIVGPADAPGQLSLADVPGVRQVQRTIYALADAGREREPAIPSWSSFPA